MDEMIRIIEYAKRKQKLTIEREGDPTGLIASDEYLNLLIQEGIQQHQFSQYCYGRNHK